MGSILQCSIQVIERDMTCICIVAIKDKKMGFVHIDCIYPSTSCHLAYEVTPFLLT